MSSLFFLGTQLGPEWIRLVTMNIDLVRPERQQTSQRLDTKHDHGRRTRWQMTLRGKNGKTIRSLNGDPPYNGPMKVRVTQLHQMPAVQCRFKGHYITAFVEISTGSLGGGGKIRSPVSNFDRLDVIFVVVIVMNLKEEKIFEKEQNVGTVLSRVDGSMHGRG